LPRRQTRSLANARRGLIPLHASGFARLKPQLSQDRGHPSRAAAQAPAPQAPDSGRRARAPPTRALRQSVASRAGLLSPWTTVSRYPAFFEWQRHLLTPSNAARICPQEFTASPWAFSAPHSRIAQPGGTPCRASHRFCTLPALLPAPALLSLSILLPPKETRPGQLAPQQNDLPQRIQAERSQTPLIPAKITSPLPTCPHPTFGAACQRAPRPLPHSYPQPSSLPPSCAPRCLGTSILRYCHRTAVARNEPFPEAARLKRWQSSRPVLGGFHVRGPGFPPLPHLLFASGTRSQAAPLWCPATLRQVGSRHGRRRPRPLLVVNAPVATAAARAPFAPAVSWNSLMQTLAGAGSSRCNGHMRAE
jgi:hypothetical protein